MSRVRLLAVVILTAALPAPPARALTDADVADAITRLRQYFWANLDLAAGTWEHLDTRADTYKGGVTAIITLAMLSAGESAQDPRLARALAFLRATEMDKTYCVALRAQVWGTLPKKKLTGIEKDAQWLLDAARSGSTYSYTNWRRGPAGAALNAPPPPGDHSNSQYGLLGLWAAARRGVQVDRTYWQSAAAYWISAQNPDGGWDYTNRDDGPSYGSMTAAGLTALLVAQQQLYRDRPTAEPRLTRAVERGRAWLDERFAGLNNPGRGGTGLYYLYSIERVGLASGVRYLNGRDWFRDGAQALVRRVRADGHVGGASDTAFALLFLARGRVPVWATKLTVPGPDAARFNNRPNDLHLLTRFLSDTVETELNWQTVSLDRDPRPGPGNSAHDQGWLNSPVAYLAGDTALRLSAEQKANLKRYLDLGGLLVANADNGAGAFAQSVRELADELYPHLPMKTLPETHAIYHIWHRVPQTGGQRVDAVGNGARELIILAGRDWGYDFQSNRTPEQLNATFRLASNLFALATQRGHIPGRLDPRYEARRDGVAKTGTFTIGRARYGQGGKDNLRGRGWLPEPAAWEQLGNHVYNRTGLDVGVTPATVADLDFTKLLAGGAPAHAQAVLDLDDLADCKLPLVHLTGVERAHLTDTQLAAIEAYAKAGGTLLIETVGGAGGFAPAVEKQLTQRLGKATIPLPKSHPLFTGQDLAGGHAIDRVRYRRHALVKLGVQRGPRLLAFYVGDRPAILVSAEDLTLGMMRSPRDQIVGYGPDTARAIMTNLVLWCAMRNRD